MQSQIIMTSKEQFVIAWLFKNKKKMSRSASETIQHMAIVTMEDK